MAKEAKAHNLTSFPALLEISGVEIKTEKAKTAKKDADGKDVLDAQGNKEYDTFDFKFPVFPSNALDSIVSIMGAEKVVAIINDEAKVIWRNQPTAEQLQENAIKAMIKSGVAEATARAFFA